MSRIIHIFYRHAPMSVEARSRDPHKRRPQWFSYESCFKNLLATISGDKSRERVRITIMFDGSEEDYFSDFTYSYRNHLDGQISLQLLQAGSDKLSGLLTTYYANSQLHAENDIVYFLENDYLHQPHWITKVLDLYDSVKPFDYVSLYDHPDKYFYDMYTGLESKIISSRSHHWRTTPSTCGSFLFEVGVLKKDFEILTTGLPDFYLFKELSENRGRVLLSPIVGLSTHCMEGYLSPHIDWSKQVA